MTSRPRRSHSGGRGATPRDPPRDLPVTPRALEPRPLRPSPPRDPPLGGGGAWGEGNKVTFPAPPRLRFGGNSGDFGVSPWGGRGEDFGGDFGVILGSLGRGLTAVFLAEFWGSRKEFWAPRALNGLFTCQSQPAPPPGSSALPLSLRVSHWPPRPPIPAVQTGGPAPFPLTVTAQTTR